MGDRLGIPRVVGFFFCLLLYFVSLSRRWLRVSLLRVSLSLGSWSPLLVALGFLLFE